MQTFRILLLASFARILTASLAVFFDRIFTDYDTSSRLLVDCDGVPWDMQDSKESFIVWDSVFFRRIGECGYEFEQYHAFFPALPSLLRWISRFFPSSHHHILCSLILSNVAYIISAILFAKYFNSIGVVWWDEASAVSATLFYCLPPSSIFQSVLYTESFFALVTMSALYLLYVRDSPLLASLVFGLSCTFRSNGILHVGYLAHYQVHKGLNSRNQVIKEFIKGVVYIFFCLLPFVVFQIYGYVQFCIPVYQRPWCQHRLPYLYGFVQKEYWNVGFLSYYQFSQAPNFLLAAPALLISFHGMQSYLKANWNRGWGLGLTITTSPAAPDRGYYRVEVAPFVWQTGLMALFCLLLMHVEVCTRFLSSCPGFYWSMANLCSNKTRQRLLVFYCVSYCFLGALLFPNFYPWT